MYRYILQSGEQDLITLNEELKFLNSYIYLIKTRYRDRIVINIDIEAKFLNENIPTLTLQLLVENAIKHNEISESKPLEIKVYSQENNLIVENKIQPRTSLANSTGKGLGNISKRYLLLKNKNISITNANCIFKIKLPIK